MAITAMAMRRIGLLLLVLLLLLGCGGQASKQGLHKDCSTGAACASGQLCMQYTGFAGQPLSSCEIPCTYESDCPAPLQCVAVADGPMQLTCQ